jgi:hypothetical protein
MSQPDLGNRFIKFQLDGGEAEAARCITPYNMMFIQNKIADYASSCVEYQYDPNSTNQFAAILEHEKNKARVQILEELLTEFQVPTETKSEN